MEADGVMVESIGRDALFARNTGLTDEQRQLAKTWTNIDEDLDGVDSAVADYVLGKRADFIHVDLPRYSRKPAVPDDVVLYDDINYLDDGQRAHRLDVLLPEDAVSRGGAPIPVVIEVHGGAFLYGYKELNRSHSAQLAHLGYAVVSLNYTLYPKADFIGQLEDLSAALRWVAANADRYLLDASQTFITGDSAGSMLALYLIAIEHNREFADAIGIPSVGLRFHAAGLVSGMTNLDNVFDQSATDRGSLIDSIRPSFDRLRQRLQGSRFSTLTGILDAIDIPPMWMVTSTDDFLEASSLELAIVLRARNIDHCLIDDRAGRNECLPHDFAVGLPSLPESMAAMDSMVSFFDEHQQPRLGLHNSQ